MSIDIGLPPLYWLLALRAASFAAALYFFISITIRPNFANVLPILPVAVAQACYGGVAICYVLPVLWMG